MFKQPWFLLLFLLLPLFLWFRQQRYYLRHAYTQPLARSARKNYWRIIKLTCFYLSLIFLFLAAADPQIRTLEQKRTLQVHKYILINDGSGSMVDGGKERGVGRALGTVMKGNDKFLELLSQRDDGSKDLVGAVVFSNEAFIVSHLVDDPKFVGQKLSYVDYKTYPMGAGTQLEKALWAGVFMVLNVNKGTELSDDMKYLQTRMYGQGERIKQDSLVEKVITSHKEQVKGSSLVVFTDGEFSQPEGGPNIMSCYKIMDFCKMIGIRVYVISVEQLQSPILMYCKETGGNGVVIRQYNQELFNKAYTDIVQSQTNEYITVERESDRSLAMWLAVAGLGFFCMNVFLANTFGRAYTEL